MRKLLLLAVAMALLAGLGSLLVPSNERLILKHLTSLAGSISIRPGQSPLARLAGASQAVEFFTPDVTVQVEGLDFTVNDRNDLREALISARAQLRVADVRFVDVHVKFPDEKHSAVAYLSAVAHLDGQTNAFGRALKMTLQKSGRTWLISRVESLAMGP